MTMTKNNRVGEIGFNRCGSRMTIIEYNNATNIIVMFDDGYTIKAEYGNFKKGAISSPYDKSIYGVGYIGEGDYNATDGKIATKEYTVWRGMIERCYSDKLKAKRSTYEGCQVAEEWHNFQNFAKWYSENYYIINDETMHLDKDILVKGNKIYSPNTCVFVTRGINSLFTKNNSKRNNLPIGVSFYSDRNKYKATCSIGLGKNVHIGMFNTPKEAFYAYKQYKEKVIKDVAERYKDKIPSKLYNALITYEVEIDD